MATRKFFTKEQDPVAFLDMVQQMAVHLSCLDVAFQTDLVDTRFKAAEVNNAVRTMRNSIKVINAYINRVTRLKESKDVFAYEYIPELFEVVRNLMFCSPETLAQMAQELNRLRTSGGGEFELNEKLTENESNTQLGSSIKVGNIDMLDVSGLI